MTTYFISRHQGAKDWAQQQGIEVDQMLNHLELESIQPGDVVIGSLPINLVAELNQKGASYLHLTLVLPEHLRGKELSAADMQAAGAKLQQYRVEVAMKDDSSGTTNEATSAHAESTSAYSPLPPISGWKKTLSLCKYAREKRAGHILIVFCVVLLTLLIVRPIFIAPMSANTDWWDWAEPIIGCLTLGTAFSVWLGELRQDWENNLPKRLNIYFHYNGNNRLVCTGLRVAAEGDIRALAQQVGKQMNGNILLDFDPFITQEKDRIIIQQGKIFKEYTLRFELLEDVAKEKNHLSRQSSSTSTPVKEETTSSPEQSKEAIDLQYLRKNKKACIAWIYDVDGKRAVKRD